MRTHVLLVSVLLGSLASCASTKVQPLTAKSFSVSTSAAIACGQSGAAKVANHVAAVEVIKRGGDRFYFKAANSDYRLIEDSLVVQMVQPGDPEFKDAFSARDQLGPDWQQIVAKGIPNTCAG